VQRGNGHCFPGSVNESSKVSPVSTKKTTSGRMLGCYILCSESLVEVDRLTVEVEGIDNKSKVEVVRLGKVEVKESTTSRRSRWFDWVKLKSKTSTTSRRGQPSRRG
jgi:hypothetical protein